MLRRREFVELAASLLVAALLPIAAGCRSQGPSCSDGDALSTPERTLRASNEYTENSALGPEKSCSRCQFFRAGAPEACGVCQILGGPVNPAGHCNSWAAKT
jgi:hypothetical protein